MNIRNESKIYSFTKSLYEITVQQNISLIQGLKIIGKGNKNKEIRLAASFLESQLYEGFMFSNALVKCPNIFFDSSYVSFMRLAERTGNYRDAISFLLKRCERREKTFFSLLGASLYPLFVIVLCISGIISVEILNRKFYSTSFFETENMLLKIIGSFSFLVIVCFLIYEILRMFLGENKLYEAFLAIGFLVKSGISVDSAVGYAIYIVGPNSKLGEVFRIAQERLEYGMDLITAFGAGKENSVFTKDVEEAFYYAQICGNKSDVFEKLAMWIEKSDEKKKKVCFSLLEPIFIAATGLILVLLMVNFLFPMISNFNLVF